MHSAILPALLLSVFSLAAPAHAADAAKKAPPQWDYRGGANDDEDWGLLSPDFKACAVGTYQSPVAINAPSRSSLPPIRFTYSSSKMLTQKREHALILQFWEGNSIRSEGVDYQLKQIRFHTPAEHSLLLADNLPLEMHFIHQSKDNQVLIVAVQAKLGAEHAAMQEVIGHLPEKDAPEKTLRFNPEALLPEKQGYYAYTGSLSWPPCTEGIEWRVMKQPIEISEAQLKSLGKLIGRNARLLQPLYFRTVRETID